MSPKFHIVQTLQSFQYSQSLTIVVKMVWKRVEKFLLNKSSSCWLLIFHKAITRDLHAGMFYRHLQTCSHPQSISFICFSTYLLQVSFGLPLFLFSNGVFLIATPDTLLFIGYGVWQKRCLVLSNLQRHQVWKVSILFEMAFVIFQDSAPYRRTPKNITLEDRGNKS